MTTIGYSLSCEEHGPKDLVEQAKQAQDAGFQALWISDHFHPWTDEQGHSPFVWSVIGAVAEATDLPVTTAVTCPTTRIHPAVVAQAAATAAVLLDGRFTLGVGTGEALNEHILGDRWPTADVRLAMLDEAVQVMRRLWTEDVVHHHGEHYTVEDARIYDRPDTPVPVHVSAFGPKALDVAARIGEGFITTMPDEESVQGYRSRGGKGPITGGVKVAWAPTAEQGVQAYHRLWRHTLAPGEMAQVLPSPAHFAQLGELVTPEMVAEKIPAGPDPEVHHQAVRSYLDAGFDEVYVGQVGEHPAAFFDLYAKEILPSLR